MRLLVVLANHGPSSVSDLAGAIGVDQPRASRLVQAAVDAGHVRREVDPPTPGAASSSSPKRDAPPSRPWSTTGAGAIERALADFTPAERAEFARLLTRFAQAWGRG